VVVSKPTGDFGGVVQYDFGKTVGRLTTSNLLAKLRADQMMETNRIPKFLSEMITAYPRMRADFAYRGQEQDRLLMSHPTTTVAMGFYLVAWKLDNSPWITEHLRYL
jgi:hypothetical protein